MSQLLSQLLTAACTGTAAQFAQRKPTRSGGRGQHARRRPSLRRRRRRRRRRPAVGLSGWHLWRRRNAARESNAFSGGPFLRGVGSAPSSSAKETPPCTPEADTTPPSETTHFFSEERCEKGMVTGPRRTPAPPHGLGSQPPSSRAFITHTDPALRFKPPALRFKPRACQA